MHKNHHGKQTFGQGERVSVDFPENPDLHDRTDYQTLFPVTTLPGRISESCKLSTADRRSHGEIVVAAPLCWGVPLSSEHGSRRVLHSLGEGGVPWLQPATQRCATLVRDLRLGFD